MIVGSDTHIYTYILACTCVLCKLHRRFTHVLVTCVALTKVLDSFVVNTNLSVEV